MIGLYIPVNANASVTDPVVVGEKQFHSRAASRNPHSAGDGVRLVFARTTRRTRSPALFFPCHRFLVRFTVLLVFLQTTGAPFIGQEPARF